MVNGRWVYQKPGEDRFLEYGDKYWLGNSGVGRKSGHLHHHGGSVCPEHIQGDWEVSRQDEDDGTWSWQEDEDLKVECVREKDVREEHADHSVGHSGKHSHPPYSLPLISRGDIFLCNVKKWTTFTFVRRLWKWKQFKWGSNCFWIDITTSGSLLDCQLCQELLQSLEYRSKGRKSSHEDSWMFTMIENQ